MRFDKFMMETYYIFLLFTDFDETGSDLALLHNRFVKN